MIAWIKGIGWRRPILSALCLLLVALWFRDWRHAQPLNDGTWKRVQETGVLRVGMDASYPPFGDTPRGVPVGLDVDIVNEIGRRLNLRVEIVNMGFDGLYNALTTGQVDMLISALSINPAQLGRVMYAASYIDAGQVLVSPNAEFAGVADLDGHMLAVEYGSLGDETARLWQRRLHVLKLAHFTAADGAMVVVSKGQADAALVDYVTARLYLRAHPGLIIDSAVVVGDVYAPAVRLLSYDLGGAVSDVIRAMRQDGTLDTILNRWL